MRRRFEFFAGFDAAFRQHIMRVADFDFLDERDEYTAGSAPHDRAPRANPVPVEVAVEAARQARADGVTVFTIGLGDDLDLEALAAMASRPHYFSRAPTAEALADIYRDIAGELPCSAGVLWPGW